MTVEEFWREYKTHSGGKAETYKVCYFCNSYDRPSCANGLRQFTPKDG